MRFNTRGMRRGALCATALLCTVGSAGAQQTLTLQQAIDLAQRNGLAARAAVSTRDAARSREHSFYARRLPQFFLTGNVPQYNRSIIPVLQPDGTTLFKPQQETNSNVNLTIAQQLPITGGSLLVSSRLTQLKRSGTTSSETWNSTPFSVLLRQPLLQSNSQAWDGREQNLRGDAAEQQYLEAREDVALQVVDAFFAYFAARTTRGNSEINAAINDTLFRMNQGRFEVGKIGENDLGQSELQLLRSRNALDAARLEHDRTLAALRLVLNLRPNEPLDVAVTSDVPPFEADTILAVQQALRNRAAITDLRLQDVQARRRISETRLNNGPNATFSASYGYNATATEMNLAYRDLANAQTLTLGVSIPLLRWGANSADVQAARADLDRVTSNATVAREQVTQEAHFGALQLAQSRRQLLISAKADTVARKRFEAAYNRYGIGRIGIDNLVVAQNDKDQALLAYVQALRGYWTAHYRLRKVTLYDFEKGNVIR
ncbi:MAG: TolC family protein [Gemmatimonadaceae bacterium]